MFDLKSFFLSLVLTSLVFKIRSQYKPQLSQCDNIIFQAEGEEVKQILQNFEDVDTVVQEYKFSCGDRRVGRLLEENVSRIRDLPMFDIRFDTFPKKCLRTELPKNCAQATACTHLSGIYKIEVPLNDTQPFYVECDDETENGNWNIIQRRQDGSVDFYRTWDEYEKGFGDIDGEFFIGLENLYALTNGMGTQELLIIMEKDNNISAYALYDSFAIANATDLYMLRKLGRYTGNAGDSLQSSIGCKFSTKDRKNHDGKENCAVRSTGAWWYDNCHQSNLNGRYGDKSNGRGINWYSFTTYKKSLKYVKMMIRRRRFK